MSRDDRDIVRTWDGLVAGEMRQRNALKTIDDQRRPKTKSPVIIQLAWLGDELIEPGHAVKLVASLVDPTIDDSAPYSGLSFLARPFEEGEPLQGYAITMGPIKPASTAAGTLSTRTDGNTGTLTLGGGHGIVTGDVLTLVWEGGSRSGVTVGTVAGTLVPIDGGSGGVLPDATTDVTALRSADLGDAVIPEAYWARVNVSLEDHTHANMVSGGTLLESTTGNGLPILWKQAGEGEQWAIISFLNDEDRKVASDFLDGVPGALIDKLNNTGIYNPSVHDLALAQVVPDLVGNPPNNKVRIFVPKAEGSGSDQFRIFELVERKYSTESAATVRWLNYDLLPNLGEEAETIFDPMLRFAGASVDYAPWNGEQLHGMRGIAQLWNDRPYSVAGTLTTRTDDDTGVLTMEDGHGIVTGNVVDVYWEDGSRTGMDVGTVSTNTVQIDGGEGDNLPADETPVNVVNQNAVLGDPIWKIVAMEGFAQFIKARIYGVTTYPAAEDTNYEARWSSIIEKPASSDAANWERYPPTEAGQAVGYADDLAMYRPVVKAPYEASGEIAGDWVYMQIADRDTDPPTYRVYQVNHPSRRIRGTVVDPGDGYVAKADGTFQLTSLSEVYGGPPPDAPLTVAQTYANGYVAGQLTEAVFNEDSATWENLPDPRKSLASLYEDNNGFGYVVASQLAGAGLAVEVGTGPPKTDGTGNTDKLKVVSVPPPTSEEEGDGVVIVNSVTGVEVSIDSGGTLTVKINYDTKYVYGAAGSGGDAEDTVDIWNKQSIEEFESAGCSDGAVVIETNSVEVLIPPS